MCRVTSYVLCAMLLVTSLCRAQSLADAARENRKQKAKDGDAAGKVITSDDFSAPPDVTIHLVPGTSSTGQGTVVAPGRGKHAYAVTNLDATRFISGGVLHITITVGDGASEASFDLYPQGARYRPKDFRTLLPVPTTCEAALAQRLNIGLITEPCSNLLQKEVGIQKPETRIITPL